jgi:hypothetical protein
MIRSGYEILDTQLNLLRLFEKLTASAPWSRWQPIEGYPETQYFSIAKPLIYIEPPYRMGAARENQAGLAGHWWSVTLGCWDENKCGGINEIAMISNSIITTFTNPQTLYGIKYNINYYGTAYTNTSLIAQGIRMQNLTGPRWITKDSTTKQFRLEFDLNLLT